MSVLEVSCCPAHADAARSCRIHSVESVVATPEVSCCCEDLSLSLSQPILAQTHLWHAHDHPPAFALRAAQHGLAYECPRLSILVAPSSALCCASQMAWPWVQDPGLLVRGSTCRNARRTCNFEVLRETLNSRQTEILLSSAHRHTGPSRALLLYGTVWVVNRPTFTRGA